MNQKCFLLCACSALLCIGLILGTAICHASPISISLNTSPLMGQGTFSVVFDLFDGDATPNNSVVITNIAFGGGAPFGNPTYTGGATGDLASTVTLSDFGGFFFNEFVQGFTPGSVLSFVIDMTANFAGGTPDSFAFLLLDDATGLPIPTLDSLGTDTLLRGDISSSVPTFQTFGSDPARTTTIIQAPQVTTAVPEPGTTVLLCIGIVAVSIAWRWGQV